MRVTILSLSPSSMFAIYPSGPVSSGYFIMKDESRGYDNVCKLFTADMQPQTRYKAALREVMEEITGGKLCIQHIPASGSALPNVIGFESRS